MVSKNELVLALDSSLLHVAKVYSSSTHLLHLQGTSLHEITFPRIKLCELTASFLLLQKQSFRACQATLNNPSKRKLAVTAKNLPILQTPTMSAIDQIATRISAFATRFQTQLQARLENTTAQDYIRLVIIIGSYALLRPYLIKLGAKFQAKDHERELDSEEVDAVRKSADKSSHGDSLKGKVQIPEDTDSDSEDEGKKSTDWGKTARRRQRRVIRTMLEQEEERRKEEEETTSDKEIEQFLVE